MHSIADVDSGDIARNTECDYSSAYVSIFTDGESPLVGHGMTFTIGRGNEIVSWLPASFDGDPMSFSGLSSNCSARKQAHWPRSGGSFQEYG